MKRYVARTVMLAVTLAAFALYYTQIYILPKNEYNKVCCVLICIRETKWLTTPSAANKQWLVL